VLRGLNSSFLGRLAVANPSRPLCFQRFGDHVPLLHLKFRCAKRGSRRTDFVVMGKGGINVQPWRQIE
jgi:hypothetical protein